jgi:hypothetical protein
MVEGEQKGRTGAMGAKKSNNSLTLIIQKYYV